MEGKVRVLVTGATGFIGSRVVSQLRERNLDCVCLSQSSSEDFDLCEQIRFNSYSEIPNLIQKISPDACVHLAAKFSLEETVENLEQLILSNISLTTMVFKGLSEARSQKAIYVGTAWQDKLGLGSESLESVYAITKKSAFDVAKYICNQNDIKFHCIKLSDTFGVGDKRQKIFNLMINATFNNEPIRLSPGYQEILLTPVNDVVDAINGILLGELRIDSDSYHMPGHIVTLRDLSLLIEEIFERKGMHIFGALDYRRGTQLFVDTSQAKFLPIGLTKLDEIIRECKEYLIKTE